MLLKVSIPDLQMLLDYAPLLVQHEQSMSRVVSSFPDLRSSDHLSRQGQGTRKSSEPVLDFRSHLFQARMLGLWVYTRLWLLRLYRAVKRRLGYLVLRKWVEGV